MKRSLILVVAVLLFLPTFAFGQQILTAALSGANEPFGGDPDGSGTAVIVLNNNTITFVVTTSNIGKINYAVIRPVGETANILFLTDLSTPTPESGVYTGTITINDPNQLALLNDLKANPSGYYVNVQTTDLPIGALRGGLTGGTQQISGGTGTPGTELPSTCTDSDTAMCVNGGRFKVEVSWRSVDGNHGQGHAVRLTKDSGYFWFFNQDNAEMLVKALNGCSIGNNNWVFASGTTNVEVTMKVTDTATGKTKRYINPQGNPFLPIQDTSAFSCQ